MQTQITINDALIFGLGIVGIVCIVFLTILIIKLTKTLKKVDDILDDAKVVSSTAREGIETVDSLVNDTVTAVDGLVTSMKESQGLITTIGSVAKACSNLATYFGKNRNNDEE